MDRLVLGFTRGSTRGACGPVRERRLPAMGPSSEPMRQSHGLEARLLALGEQPQDGVRELPVHAGSRVDTSRAVCPSYPPATTAVFERSPQRSLCDHAHFQGSRCSVEQEGQQPADCTRRKPHVLRFTSFQCHQPGSLGSVAGRGCEVAPHGQFYGLRGAAPGRHGVHNVPRPACRSA